MTALQIADSALRDFLLETKLIETNGTTARAKNISDNIQQLWHSVLQQGIHDGGVLVLFFPDSQNKSDKWLIVGREKYPLVRAFQQIRRFVMPTYAIYRGSSSRLTEFNRERSTARKVAADLFAGAFTLYAQPKERLTILSKLNQWYGVNKFKTTPEALTQQQPTYPGLRLAFEKALAGQDWERAEHYLLEIQNHNLTTAENLLFLRYQLLAQQSSWKRLWQHHEFRDAAQIYVPRDVKRAMLTAFHSTELMPYEIDNQLTTALDKFNELRPQLGDLLITRQGLKDPQILSVFAYQATLEKNSTALKALRTETNDIRIQAIIDVLYATFEPEDIAPEDVPVALLKAFLNNDFDTCWLLTNRLDDWQERLYARLQVAYFSHNHEYCQIVYHEFSELYSEQQEQVSIHFSHVQDYLTIIKQRLPHLTQAIADWKTWFSEFEKAAEDVLTDSLQVLREQLSEIEWDDAQLQAVTSRINALWLETNAPSKPLFQQAISYLMHHFLREADFPKTEIVYSELYEVLYGILSDWSYSVQNTKLWIRLAEARLTHNPSHLNAVISDFEKWFAKPSKDRIEVFQESIDLLAAYGTQATQFTQLIQQWLTDIALPEVISLDLLEWRVWAIYADWAYLGEHLQHRIHAKIEALLQREDDVIGRLPSTQIAIFTLDSIAAKRAEKLLLERNPKLDIRINSDKQSTKEATSLATTADMVVVVTSCVTHALTYSIIPLVTEPIYPISRGTTSIVRAIEDAARQLMLS